MGVGAAPPRPAAHRGEVELGLGRIVALYFRSSVHTRVTNMFGASISEPMRPNPRSSTR
jgi:hypothetical protein